MPRLNTADKLKVIIYAGTKGCQNYNDICQHYTTLGTRKPTNVYEVAVDRSEAVYSLSLPPDQKIFIVSPGAGSGGQLTPSSTADVFEYNGRKWDQLIDSILEQARKLRAKEIDVVFLLTAVGGTGFTFALNFARLLKTRLAGRVTCNTFFIATTPPLDVIERPSGLQDALKSANTLFALKHTVADADRIDLAYIRFPYQLTASDHRIGFLMQGLGILPIEDVAQGNPFQQEQLIGIASEKRYNLILETDQIIRFPKQQIKQRNIAASELTKAKASLALLENEFEQVKKQKAPTAIEHEVNSLSERIARMRSVRSKRWRRTLAEAESRTRNAELLVKDGLKEAKKAEEILENLAEQIQSLHLQIQKLDAIITQLDEELAMGHFRDGQTLLRVTPEEREKLDMLPDTDKMPLETIMTKLGREKELFDLVQGETQKSVEEIFVQYHGIRFPQDARRIENLKIVVSSPENTEHLTPSYQTQIVNDASFKDEVLIVALSMVELESFDFVHKMLDTIQSWDVPVSKRLSLPENKGLKQAILQTRLCCQNNSAIMKTLVEASSVE